MTRSRITTLMTYGLLSVGAMITFALPKELSVPAAWPAPAASSGGIRLTGIVRDFRAAHDDFDVIPDLGYGHYAGNVGETLTSRGAPSFNGAATGGPPDDDLVAHWTFDEGVGTTVGDLAGASPGTAFGATWVPGKMGSGLHFDGTDDYVNVPSTTELMISSDVTISGWFKLDEAFDASSPTSQIIVEKFLDNEHDTTIALVGTDYGRSEPARGAFVFKVENGPTTDYYRYKWTNTTTWNAGEWYHFACVLDVTDSAQNTILINGVDDTAAADAGTQGPGIDWNYAVDFRIGGKDADEYQLSEPRYFKGVLDEIQIHERRLTEGDLTAKRGYLVTQQWRDREGQPIAPHLAIEPPVEEVLLASAPTLDGSGVVDGFDSTVGPYGGTNVLPAPTFVTGTAMPTVVPPSGLPFTADVIYDGPGSSTLASDIHCDNFAVSQQHVLTITGDRTIVCDNDFRVENQGRVELAPGATLTVYAVTNALVENAALVNVNTGDPSRVRIYALADEFLIKNSGQVYADVITPSGHLRVENSSDYYGRFMGSHLELQNVAGFHHDRRAVTICGEVADDVAGLAGGESSGGITSSETFAQWFEDALGVNMSAHHSIQLVDTGGGVYEHWDDAFFPIDDRLYGNEGLDHNYLFTYEIHAKLQYEACTGQFLEFEGVDDAWFFVDGKLVIDLGGVRPGTTQRIELDRLELTDGELYPITIAYAQRQTTSAVFRLRTNVPLLSDPVPPTVSASFD